MIGARHRISAHQRAALDLQPDHRELSVLKPEAGVAGGSKAEKRIGPVADRKNLLSMKRAHGPGFPITFWHKAARTHPFQCTEAPVAIEELQGPNYPNFSDSQHAAVRDNRLEIAEPADFRRR
jgi:hypothetical protein